ncbi:MAG: hypothetical protein JKY80_04240 [Mariprofundaceae bacterium]|nr:hypothetical protein [Mariprofundaceae bacterium]
MTKCVNVRYSAIRLTTVLCMVALFGSGCSTTSTAVNALGQAMNNAIGQPNHLLFQNARHICKPKIRDISAFEAYEWRKISAPIFEKDSWSQKVFFKLTDKNVIYTTYGLIREDVTGGWFPDQEDLKTRAICITDRQARHIISVKIEKLQKYNYDTKTIEDLKEPEDGRYSHLIYAEESQ